MAIETELITTAARLLEQWLPSDPRTGGPTWRIRHITGSAPSKYEEKWESTPELAKVAVYGAFPETFGPGGDRFPVKADLVTFAEPDDWIEGEFGPRASAGRPATDTAVYAIAALAKILEEGSGPLDSRVRPLAGFLAGELTGDAVELLTIQVAAEPGGTPLEDELHILVRDCRAEGRTDRLSVAPSPGAPLAGGTAHGTRIKWNASLLSEFLPLNNNVSMNFDVTVRPHSLDLGINADATFRRAMNLTHGDRLLDRDSLAAVLTETEEFAVGVALMVCLEEDDDFDDPEPPADWLVIPLLHDLIDTLTHQVTGGHGTPLLAYTRGWPLKIEGRRPHPRMILVGHDLVGVINVLGHELVGGEIVMATDPCTATNQIPHGREGAFSLLRTSRGTAARGPFLPYPGRTRV